MQSHRRQCTEMLPRCLHHGATGIGLTYGNDDGRLHSGRPSQHLSPHAKDGLWGQRTGMTCDQSANDRGLPPGTKGSRFA